MRCDSGQGPAWHGTVWLGGARSGWARQGREFIKEAKNGDTTRET